MLAVGFVGMASRSGFAAKFLQSRVLKEGACAENQHALFTV